MAGALLVVFLGFWAGRKLVFAMFKFKGFAVAVAAAVVVAGLAVAGGAPRLATARLRRCSAIFNTGCSIAFSSATAGPPIMWGRRSP